MIDDIKKFSLTVPLNRPIHCADESMFMKTDLAYLAKLVTAANRGGLQGHRLKSLVVRNGNAEQEVNVEFEWEKQNTPKPTPSPTSGRPLRDGPR